MSEVLMRSVLEEYGAITLQAFVIIYQIRNHANISTILFRIIPTVAENISGQALLLPPVTFMVVH
jgi:hypothetical protein